LSSSGANLEASDGLCIVHPFAGDSGCSEDLYYAVSQLQRSLSSFDRQPNGTGLAGRVQRLEEMGELFWFGCTENDIPFLSVREPIYIHEQSGLILSMMYGQLQALSLFAGKVD